MKILPIDVHTYDGFPAAPVTGKPEPIKPLMIKSRFKRLFPSVLRISSADKPPVSEQPPFSATKDSGGVAAVPAGAEFEPSSVCLASMVQSYMEETNDKPFRGGRHRCNCFNPNGNDSSDDEIDAPDASFGDFSDILKSLVPCASVVERNVLADTSTIIEKTKNDKQLQKSDLRKIVAVGLLSLGYDSSVCKSKWDKSPSFPAGEYEYIDVVVDGERVLIDIDFRSEFEIARSTGAYKAVLQSLPCVFVGKPERLGSIVLVVSEAAWLSFKKKGMYFAPWRKAEYMKAKWLAPYTRQNDNVVEVKTEAEGEKGELELTFGEEDKETEPESLTWQPPALKPKESGDVQRGTVRVTGLASLLN